MSDQLYTYLLQHTREPQVLRELREATNGMQGANMQVAPEQGAFMALLAELTGARRCVEVGVYTGYSSLAVALVGAACARGRPAAKKGWCGHLDAPPAASL
ncbi:hypothetical protein MNEG_4508 [Monoraphidium neglectum]|uniref:Caffeoyl-CoA O-methyltransferase n=1 Tax=Monoraphidium neglectum TaxID=145388 RepID=A0A0D2NDT3_9CHLO|nr:hypothetical protein MNEG_4508 [Monoraphidium neglectum]KIZ03451.1 hypothetical protein MNEG_4508 [Monoraphidium neglectum]|eukprot:XP_013902470.1 hypothetical protein MNEG_4508 [Monoraphidium neglectum]